MKTPNVLIIGDGGSNSPNMLHKLEARGCQCRFCNSLEDASRRIATERFDLVLSPILSGSGAEFSLVTALADSQASLFYSQVVEDGCWWVPVMRRGMNCLGSPALQPADFVGALNDLIEEIKRSEVSPAEVLANTA